MALGGSTNAIVHLVAMAGRAGIKLPLERFDEISKRTPLIANLRPSGKYLMDDFYTAGGLRAALKALGGMLKTDIITVNGRTLRQNISEAEIYDSDVIRTPETALAPDGGTAILRGNLAPEGAVIKVSAATKELLQHTGPAVVFEDYNDLKKRLDDPELDVTKDSVLVLKNAGPVGAPGMPEWGMLPVPKKLLKEGVRDMVRVSDARMSGTSYGTCVLHVSPESAVGGPLALVQTGDLIQLDAPNRQINLLVSEAELARRKAAWQPRPAKYGRGYGKLYCDHVTQAHEGADFDFLQHGPETPEPEIH
jgi:dihydroxyacid dehydratase/phosphogluconate dehydratase